MASSISSQNSTKITEITDIHPDIIATHILPRIDVLSLASTALASPQFHALCSNQEMLWTEICNNTWTSTKNPLVQNIVSTFPGGHRSLLSDSYPLIHLDKINKRRYNTTAVQRAEQLISAVDIKYKNKTVYSEVVVTNTTTEKFVHTFFKVEVFEDHEKSSCFSINVQDDEDMYVSDLKENMTLSWILIDPTQKRAANISSQWPVTVRPHWIDGDIEVKYVIILSEFVEIRITAMLKWGDGNKSLMLSKVKLQVHDIDSMCLCGKESLRILQEAIQFGKRKKAKRGEEALIHKKYVNMKWERREGKQKRRLSKTTQLISTIFVALIIVPVILKFGKC